ncbi:carbohydrate kinase [Streptomyces sp. NBC_01142]|uniref:carbohydrate kinase family protein n=1 Tax=Streptomyces sp. NBC_01142 TaxID=2975865 RepID=UPI002252DA58|nr:carbohydrate kinase [Streptomyces sp. NBC_01142]MCX4825764.1 carbohydrate kinase [Streptomyces sp. NBC_01142]
MTQSQQTSRIVVVGEALIDLKGAPDGRTFIAHPGGSPANVAYGLARLGRPVTLVTEMGDDPFGRLLHQHLTEAGVELAVPPDPAVATGMALVAVGPDGSASYDFRVRWNPPVPLAPSDAVALHTGSIAAFMEPGATAVEDMLTVARGRATVTFDPNCRPALMGDRDTARRRLERLLALTDVVKASDEDLRWLYGDSPPEAVVADWLDRGPGLVVITCGGRGALAFGRAAEAQCPAVPVAVADTVGAGDAFMSALLHGLGTAGCLGASRRALLASLDRSDLDGILRTAVLAAAVTCTRPGARPPTAAEMAAAEMADAERSAGRVL